MQVHNVAEDDAIHFLFATYHGIREILVDLAVGETGGVGKVSKHQNSSGRRLKCVVSVE
jgi:hypothetical protein